LAGRDAKLGCMVQVKKRGGLNLHI